MIRYKLCDQSSAKRWILSNEKDRHFLCQEIENFKWGLLKNKKQTKNNSKTEQILLWFSTFLVPKLQLSEGSTIS